MAGNGLRGRPPLPLPEEGDRRAFIFLDKPVIMSYEIVMTSQPRRSAANPTGRTYASLEAAYDWFNRELFEGVLPPCLITVQRHSGSYGYFSGNRFASTADPRDITDEIALNPQHFATRSPEEVLSTLAHEMVHLWQHHYGTPPSKAYHNREWALKMRSIGLHPTNTGEPGGRETGQHMTHYIEAGGRFAQVCAAFLNEHPTALYHDRTTEDEAARTARRKKAASKTKFTCAGCGANAWGKADLHLICGGCELPLVSEPKLERDKTIVLRDTFVLALLPARSKEPLLVANETSCEAPVPNYPSQ